VTKSALTILEMAADWHMLMIPQRTMWRSIAHASELLNPYYGVLV